MRGIPIARFGGKFNSSKAKVFMLLIPETHKGHWLRPRQVHDTLGIPLGSLLVLMAKWSGPDWRKLQRRKKDGYFEYQSTFKGEKWKKSDNGRREKGPQRKNRLTRILGVCEILGLANILK